MTTEPLATAPLTLEHAEAAFRLSTEAGWNQSVADWRLMIAHGEAWGQFTPWGGLVASALILPYAGSVAWVAMVLTTARHRRRGLATRNLHHAIERCAKLGLIAGLDATPAGREVYRPLGFGDVFPLHRLVADVPRPAALAAAGGSIRPVAEADLDAIIGLDADVFGAPRPHVVRHLHASQPERAFLAEDGGRISAFVLARRGRAALHVGPLCAGDPNIAAALVERALEGVRGPVSIDVPDAQEEFLAWLTDSGFARARPYMRMLRDRSDLGDPARTFAIAGPELG